MRVAVVGAGVGGLACAVRLAATGHAVTVLEQGAAPGGKAGRVVLEADGVDFLNAPGSLKRAVRDCLKANLPGDTGQA